MKTSSGNVNFLFSGEVSVCIAYVRGMDDKYYEKVCACALNRIFGNEPQLTRSLVEHLGSFAECFNLSRKDLSEVLGSYGRKADLFCRETLDLCERELSRLSGIGCDFIPFGDRRYPPLLAECEDAPAGLYIKGDPDALRSLSPVSVIGTRDMSLYGKYWCRRIVGTIAQISSERPVVSGLALGVDITAHASALECGAGTIAVLPTGIDTVYPQRHRSFAEKISGTTRCALITDFPPGTAPMAFTFLRRNRIIAGIAATTILVESKAKGGGMITARLASGYGRNLLAVPGRIDDVRSAGCNLLLREKIADALTDMQSLTSYLEPGRNISATLQESVRKRIESIHRNEPGLSPEEIEEFVSVANLIQARRGISIEEIGERLAIGYPRASIITGFLETDGIVDIDLMQRCCIHSKIV